MTLGKKPRFDPTIIHTMTEPSSNALTTKRSFRRFVVCLPCGILSLVIVGGVGSLAMFEITVTLIFAFWIFGSALVAGRLSMIQPEVRFLWNLGYPLPVALWGISFFLIRPNELEAPIWFALSLFPLLFGIVGDRLGRRFTQSRFSNNKPTHTPVNY